MLIPILGQIVAALSRIGQSSDAAGPTGSLHAKVANVQNAMRQRTTKTFNSGNVPTSLTTVLSVTGTGSLSGVTASTGNGGGDTRLVIIIDGATVFDATTTGGYGLSPIASGGWIWLYTTTSQAQLDWQFKSSLVIQCASTNASYPAVVKCGYNLE